ncbi:MAG: gamma-glutamyl-phosphate reductase, partial [Proteobacteria bacterium]|nr:gamma-glutamyl-phosphate reductase [Pseudomonadota bacterium]
MSTIEETIKTMAVAAKKAAQKMIGLSTESKNRVLLRMADALVEQKEFIRRENEKDLEAGRTKGLSSAMLDRLNLSDKVMAAMINGLKEVVALPDPVGEVTEMVKRPNGI